MDAMSENTLTIHAGGAYIEVRQRHGNERVLMRTNSIISVSRGETMHYSAIVLSTGERIEVKETLEQIASVLAEATERSR